MVFQKKTQNNLPAGNGQYFTERVSNAIERPKYTFGVHMSTPRPPAHLRNFGRCQKFLKKAKNHEQLFFNANFHSWGQVSCPAF